MERLPGIYSNKKQALTVMLDIHSAFYVSFQETIFQVGYLVCSDKVNSAKGRVEV